MDLSSKYIFFSGSPDLSHPIPDPGSGNPDPGIRNRIYNVFLFREADIQHVDASRLFHTPGVFYRPATLKTMTALLGNTETREVYNNFNLENLHQNDLDYTHYMYQKYLEYAKFIPPGNNKYFSHTMYNKLPNPISTDEGKGLFNIFPLDLDSDEIKPTHTSLGVVNTSPLKLELEFSAIPTITWFLMTTFVYLNKINFPGSKTKQEVTYDFL